MEEAAAPGSARWSEAGIGKATSLTTEELVLELLRRLQAGSPIKHEHDQSPRLLGALELQLGLLGDVPSNRYSNRRMRMLMEELLQHPGFEWDAIHGATCVELGCGAVNPLGGLMVLCALGARRCVGVDLDPVQSVPLAVRALHRCAVGMLSADLFPGFPTVFAQVQANLRGFDLRRLERGDPAGIAADRLAFAQTSAEALPFEDGAVDVSSSHSFLEHVPDIEAVVAELARVSSPGALGSHRIDGIDHRYWGSRHLHPLEFLTVRSEKPIVYGCNRVRPKQLTGIFLRHGFDVVQVEETHPVDIADDFRSRLAEPYRSLPDDVLKVGGALFHVRRH